MLLGFFISPSFTLVEVSMADVVSPSLAEIGLIFSFSCMEGPILISGYIYEGIGGKRSLYVCLSTFYRMTSH